MYAQVIVDVPSDQTNRTFDYIVPAEWREWIAVGSRVGVPFGGRTLQGFVVGLSEWSAYDRSKLKPIAQLLDLVPPLNEELVQLARWMSQKYVCREIAALQAMIPGALKAKYEKYVSVPESDESVEASEFHQESSGCLSPGQTVLFHRDPEDEELIAYVRKRGTVSLDALQKRFPHAGARIMGLLARGEFIESQLVGGRLKTKKTLFAEPAVPREKLLEESAALPARAKRQKDLADFFAEHPEPVPLAVLTEQHGFSTSTVKAAADKGLIAIKQVEQFRDPYEGREFARTKPLPLTGQQLQVFQPLVEALHAKEGQVFLLHGVTGSGKTEVYLQAISQCLEQGREAIVLVPEISLTPQMVERFKSRFGDAVAVLHSRLSQGERYDEWRKISLKKASVAIGARSAVFAPFTRLGLIIIDEEHEASYKQEESPKYHARDVAIRRAAYHGAVVVLGSATPSLESYARAIRNDAAACAAAVWPSKGSGDAAGSVPMQAQPEPGVAPYALESAPFRLLSMTERVEGRPLPAAHVIDMREELKSGNRSMFSRKLYQAIEDRLEKKEQIVLLLNRRGYSTFVMCRTCGYVAQCPHCDISLTYHQVTRSMRCHYCGLSAPEPKTCPSCGSEHIRYFGTGTQRVEEELGKLFPGVRVIRMDVDTTSEKGAHERLLDRFRKRQADILLGTQMVAKGLDFPFVTLVGVITADTVLHLPDFRAAEKTFQLLTQVAGRAGRHQLPGEVFIQTYTPDHYSIVNASRHDYAAFLAAELETRLAREYPPFCELALVTFSHEELPFLMRAGESFAARLREGWSQFRRNAGSDAYFEVFGPVASPIPRIKDRYRFQCMIKYRGDVDVSGLLSRTAAAFSETVRKEKLQISIDVNPQVLL